MRRGRGWCDRRGVRRRGRRVAATVLAVALVGSLSSAAAASAADFTWSGAGATPNWSDPANWSGTAPAGAVGTLEFPSLAPAGCNGTCIPANNDRTGLSAAALAIDAGSGYAITGSPLTLGSGGMTVASAITDADRFTTLGPALTLAAAQTWSMAGGPRDHQELRVTGPVSGPSIPLGITLTRQAVLALTSVEAGPIAITGNGFGGSGFVKLGFTDAAGALVPGALNAVDQLAVRVRDGGGLWGVRGTVGPLTSAGGIVAVGETDHAGTLGAVGDIVLDSQSVVQVFMNRAGTTAGADYSQLNSSGTVSLGGATLQLIAGATPGSVACGQLHPGDVDTIVSAPGGLIGRFIGVADGATVTLTTCHAGGGTPPTAVVHYTPTAVTATIATAGAPGTPTTTTLAVDPSSPVVNEPVTLTATVTPGGAPGAGSVEFDQEIDGTLRPIAGCERVAVSGSASAYTATCTAAFGASPVPKVSAAFTPVIGSPLAGSTTPTKTLSVAVAEPSLFIGVSPARVLAGDAVQLSVEMDRSTEPVVATGSVRFLQNGNAIPGCESVPVDVDPGSRVPFATCAVTATGAAGVTDSVMTAVYSGDGNFSPAQSQEAILTIVAPNAPPPPPIAPVTAEGGIGQARIGRASVTATMANVVVTCAGTSGNRCKVSLQLSMTKPARLVATRSAAARAKPKKPKAIVIGTKTITLRGGQGQTVHVKLNATGTRALRKARKLAVALTASQQTTGAPKRLSTQRITFKATPARKGS